MKPKEDRTEFQRDYDRLIFSAPFRRLQNKTQVFPLPGSIFVHNRLTHSLEVSCVGRSLGNKIASELLKLHSELHDTHVSEIGSIVSAACLAHDLGNPPFGHSGEKAIGTYFSEGKGRTLQAYLSAKEWDDFTHFEGNANAFRLLTQPVSRTTSRRFRIDVCHISRYCEIPIFLTVGRQQAKIRILYQRRRGFSEDCHELA